MSRKCELSGVGVMSGNKVSHSQRKTRRRFEPNMKVARFFSELLRERYTLRVNARCIKSVEKIGGFDEYMFKISEDSLSDRARSIRKKILDKKKELAA